MMVRFSRQALVDLAEIARTIAKDNPRRSETFTDELEASCLTLAGAPEAFQVFARRGKQEIRRKPYGNYLILYRMAGPNIDILRIVHGARNYKKQFPSVT